MSQMNVFSEQSHVLFPNITIHDGNFCSVTPVFETHVTVTKDQYLSLMLFVQKLHVS